MDNNMNEVFNGEELRIKTVGRPSGLMKKLILVAASTVAISGIAVSAYALGQNNSDIVVTEPAVLTQISENVNKAETPSNSINALNVAASNAVKQDNQEVTKTVQPTFSPSQTPQKINYSFAQTGDFNVYTDSKFVNSANIPALNEIGSIRFAGLKDNQVARTMAQASLSKDIFMAAIIAEGEGFRSGLYNDNEGKASGFGMNHSFQSLQTNEQIGKIYTKDGMTQTVLMALSNHGKFDTSNVKIDVAPQRAMQASYVYAERNKPAVIKEIAKHMKSHPATQALSKQTGQSYDTLAENKFNELAGNEQAALLYHAYKTGTAGYGKYKTLNKELITYMTTDHSEDQSKKVASSMTYKYKLNGEYLQDTRAEVLVSSMWVGKEVFGYLVGGNVAPQNIKSANPAFEKHSINVAENIAPGDIVIEGEFDKVKDQYRAQGIAFAPEFVGSANDPVANMANMRDKAAPATPKPPKRNYGGGGGYVTF